jgi:hypothetical protein
MAGMMPVKNPDGAWKYPNSGEVLKGVGLKTVGEYIAICIKSITRFIVDQPIFAGSSH